MTYNAVSSIAKQCDSIYQTKRNNSNSLMASNSSASNYKTSYSNKRNNDLDFGELSHHEKDIIMHRSKCNQCGGYFKRRHMYDGELIKGYKSYDNPSRKDRYIK